MGKTKFMENPKQKRERQERDRDIRKLYPDLTLEEIGKRYKLSRERVNQIVKKVGNNKPIKK